ncbi:hypothetical protein ACTFIR_012456 [Dictyostelium discoideum]
MNIKLNNIDKYSDRDVAIIGIGFRLPGNSNRGTELWQNLLNGFDGIVETSDRWSDSFKDLGEIHSKDAGLVELEDWESFDPIHFGINPAEAKQIDPQQKLLLKSTWEAFEDAGIDPLSLRGTYTSVFVGASASDYSTSMPENYEKPSFNVFNSTTGSIANRISYCFDFRGPSLTVDTACSSSLNACLLGYKSIVNGECNYSIVSGCNFIFNPHISRGFTTINIIGKSGRCKAFDESADGFVRAEGVAVLILKKLSMAINDGDQIYSIIRGGNSNVDGTLNKGNFMKPSKSAQSNNIVKAFESTNGSIEPSDIDFFELHGTGTPTGDPIEVEAVSDIFKSVKSSSNPLLIGSIKSNIGHLEPASGVASLMKICLMFKHRQFIKNIHFNKPNGDIKFEEWKVKVCTENTPFPQNKQVSIAINSFGITGSNVCLLLSEYTNQPNDALTTPSSTSPTLSNDIKYLIPISANSKKSLDDIKEELINNSSELSKNLPFKDFIYNQIYSKSTTLIQRSVIFANDWNDLNSNTQIISTKGNMSGNFVKSAEDGGNQNDQSNDNILVFVFCGQGPQWNKMGNELYKNSPKFRETMDLIDSIFEKHFKYSILSKLRSIQDDDKISINEPTMAQSSILMIQVSLFELYKHWGIIPTIIIGHSLGEISAAYCSGMINLETACEIIYKRSTLQKQTVGLGKMLAIGLNEKQFKDQFSSSSSNVEIVCYNSPSSIVLCGDEIELEKISNSLKEKQIFAFLLGSPSPYHSSKQELIKDQVLESTSNIKSTKPTIPIFSTVTGELYKLDQDNQFNSQYIYENTRNAVLFEKAIENIFKYIETNNLGKNIQFLELSPHPTLSHYLKEMIAVATATSDYFQQQSISVLSSLTRNKKNQNQQDEMNQILKSISELYCNGFNNINFKSQLNEPSRNEITQFKKASYYLPHYKFDDGIYFTQSESSSNYKKNGFSTNQLGIRNEQSPFISYTSYIDIAEEPFRFLKGHAAKGKALFPGCGYIDNVLRAFPNQDLTIHSMEFKSPLQLIEGIKQCLTTNIYSSGKNEYRVVFNYKDNKTGKWILSAHGKFTTNKLIGSSSGGGNNNQQQQPKKANINKYIEKCNYTKITKKDIYEGVKLKLQLHLTGPFQIIEEASYGNFAAFYKVSLKNPISSYDNQLFLNVCILDACFHSLAMGKDNQNLTLFDKVVNGQFYFDNIPKSAIEREQYQYLYCYSRVIAQVGDSYFAKIVLMLPDGTVLFKTPCAVYTEINSANNQFKLEYPNNNLYSIEKQLIDSQLNSPLIQFNQIINNLENNNNNKSLLFNLYSIIKNSNNDITLEIINESSTDQLVKSYFKISDDENDTGIINLLKSIFEILKSNINTLLKCNNSEVNNKLEINQKDSETINELIKFLINNNNKQQEQQPQPQLYIPYIKQNEIIKEIITNSVKPILNEKIKFRILEIGCGIGLLSEITINQINLLFKENPLSEINIEFTYSDSTFIQAVKEKIQQMIPESTLLSFKTLFKTININEDLLDQNFKPSYYDIIIVNGVNDFNQNKQLNSAMNNINQILISNGYLIIMDTHYKSKVVDKQIESYEQWLSFNFKTNNNNNNNNNNLTNEQWNNLLVNKLKFKEFISTSYEPYLLIVQKPTIDEIVLSSQQKISKLISSYDQIIKFDSNLGHKDNIISDILNDGSFGVVRITSIEEFEKHVETNPLTDNSLILFFSSVNDLNEINFNQVTFEYIKINQYLLKTKCKCKHILISKNSQTSADDENTCSNYLGTSVIGAFKYFSEYIDLNIYSIDYGSDIYEINLNDLILHNELTNPLKHIQREYIIRDNKIYYEHLKLESNIKMKYKSNSFIQDTNKLMTKVEPQTLEFKLLAKRELKEDEVEVKVLASGINFKDNLTYRGLVPKEATNEIGDSTDPQIGWECSGIITRIGKKVNKFKIGDSVLGTCFHSVASHVITNQDRFVLKPDSLSYVEAASIPLVYITSYYSLLVQGNLDFEGDEETVLIHSGTGGIGLAAIEILKAIGFKSLLFVTVGSKEKEQFLRDRYGSFITEIYSTRNTDYVQDIKKKIKEIKKGKGKSLTQYGTLSYGVDLILNTLSIEFMESNFLVLNQGGRIVDLSITHLSTTETTDYNKFKYFIGYSTVEVMTPSFSKVKKTLQIVVNMIKDGKLKLLPIIEYPVSEIKNAVEYISERKHIGKIVINFQTTENVVQDSIIKLNNSFENNYLFQSPQYNLNNTTFGNTILITGQKGLSLTIIKWILYYYPNQDNNSFIKDIIVLSKSTINYELEIQIGRARKKGLKTNIHFKQVDISNKNQLFESIDELYKSNKELKPIETIFHNAFVPVQSEPEDIDLQQIIDSNSAKTIGAINLYDYITSKAMVLKNYIISSSMASVMGSIRQCGYCCANAVIDSFSKYLRRKGIQCFSLKYSIIEQSGYVARNESVEKLLATTGLNSISIGTVLGSIDLALQNQDQLNNKCIVGFDFQVVSKRSNHLQYKLDFYTNQYQSNNDESNDNDEFSIKDQVLNKFSELLQIEVSKINLDIKMVDYGLDSLTVVNLKTYLDQQFVFGPNVLSISQIQKITINQLINFIKNELNKKSNYKNNNNNLNQNKKPNQNKQKQIIGSTINWENEIKLDDSIGLNGNQIIFNNENENIVLLTDATSFIGIYLLYDLIILENYKKVYCLLNNNNNSKEEGFKTIIQLLKEYKLFDKLTNDQINKIEIVCGHYSKEQFGISNEDYNDLSNQVNIILNCATDRNLNKKYEQFNEQLEGINQFVKFSLKNKIKKLIHLSAIGVYQEDPNTDDDYYLPPLESIDNIKSGYLQNRIVQEYRLRNANKIHGLPIMIIRVPFLFSDDNTGIGRDNDIVMLLLQSCYIMNTWPSELENQLLNLVPVTFASKSISSITISSNVWNQCKSLSPINNLITFNLIVDHISFGTIMNQLSNDLGWRKISTLQFIKKLDIYDNESCKTLSSFIKNQNFFNSLSIDGQYNFNQAIKNELISNNIFNGYNVDKNSIIKHLSYTFKKKIF